MSILWRHRTPVNLDPAAPSTVLHIQVRAVLVYYERAAARLAQACTVPPVTPKPFFASEGLPGAHDP